MLFTAITPIKMVPPNCVIMDIQCFKNNFNEFIIKEVTGIDMESGCLLFHHIAKPPFSHSLLSREKIKEINWLTNNHHGLEWEDGDIDYDTLFKIIKTNLTTTYTVLVKGCEKRQFIQTFVPEGCTVVDLDSVGCDSLKSLNNLYTDETLRCIHHRQVKHMCSLSNSLNMRRWFSSYSKNEL